MRHSIWASKNAYSDPSIALSATSTDGNKIYFDDFREAYSWIEQNTNEVSAFNFTG